MERKDILSSDERTRLVHALRKIREKIHWKAGKDLVHLSKRRQMGHLPLSSSIAEYENMILEVMNNGQNVLYLYEFKGYHYYAARGPAHDREWIVIFGEGGLMETAFPPEDVDDYVERRGFVLLGRIEEVLKWTELKN